MNSKNFSLAAVLTLGLLAIGQALADGQGRQLSEQERRGKFIYLRGASKSGGEITCYLGDAATEVPATAMLCSNCHGLDGRGRPEGGVIPSDITWQTLTKSYGVTHPSGRKHPPYSERAIELAITRGLDPAGNRLADTMPRYWMSREDLADLVAYLKRLGAEQDPGLTDSSIKIGSILPLGGRMAEMGQATKAALEAYFAEVNSAGGVYNRKIELRVVDAGDPNTANATAERLVDSEQVFAMAGAFIAGADKEITSFIEDKEIPLIGPYTLYPEVGFPLNRHTFYLLSGLKEQMRALVNFAGDRLQKQKPRIAILSPATGGTEGLKEAIIEQCKLRQYGPPLAVAYSRKSFDAAQLVKRLSDAGIEAIFLLRYAEEETELLKTAAKLNWTPFVFTPGAVAGKDVVEAPASFHEKVFLSFPTSPSDQTREGVLQYREFAERHKLPSNNLPAQFAAVCAAQILVEALKLTGHELSRDKLITTLEGLYEFRTGLFPPMTFGPNRRIGALGAYIVSVDLNKKEFKQAGGWIGVE